MIPISYINTFFHDFLAKKETKYQLFFGQDFDLSEKNYPI